MSAAIERRTQEQIAPDRTAALDYIRGRQSPEGGFSYYRGWGIEEPAAADTCHALKSLVLLGARPERIEDCVHWLHDRQGEDGGYPGVATAWHVTEALDCLAAAPRRDARDWLAPYSERFFDGTDGADGASDFLLSLSRYIELRRRFAIVLEPRHRDAVAAHLKRLRDDTGAFPRDGADLIGSAIALRLTLAANLLPDRRVLDFARACEDTTCGFRAVPGSRSTSLEVLAAGLFILGRFGAAPAYPRAVADRVVACQHTSGGFGRESGAIATLQDTHLALYVLDRLDVHSRSAR